MYIYMDISMYACMYASMHVFVDGEHFLQDNAASTMYFYALSGMNLEPWAHRHSTVQRSAKNDIATIWYTLLHCC